MMTSISKPHQSEKLRPSIEQEELELRHFTALQMMQRWQDIWELFYDSLWFQDRLGCCVRRAAREFGLGPDCHDDIRQEALVEFAKAIQRNSSLGYDPTKGSFPAFLVVVIYRCCLKGLRQFKDRSRGKIIFDDDFMHPYYEEHAQLEKVMDFRYLVRQIPEPFRGIVRQLLAGKSVAQIAHTRRRSKRTIYRWIDRSIEMLKARYFEEDQF